MLVSLLSDQMKASFSRAAFNCVEKNVDLRQYNDFHSKNVLLRLAATARKKLGTQQNNLTLPLVVISPKLPLMFISILEKFRCFWESNDMEWKAYDKTLEPLGYHLITVTL